MRIHNGKRCCSWCLKIVTTQNVTNEVYCSKGCHDADLLFKFYESDTRINRRRHYAELTKGGNDGKETA